MRLAEQTIKLLEDGTLKAYKDLPHGSCQTHPEILNPEILGFIRRKEAKADRQAAAN